MKNSNRHIALLLIVVFVVPIGLQSLHIIQHHTNFRNEIVSVKNYFESNEFKNETLNAQNNHCPILEYKFSHNNLHEFIRIKHSVIVTFFQYTDNYISLCKPVLLLKKSPRAPPYLSV